MTLKYPFLEYKTIFTNMRLPAPERTWNDEDKAYLMLPRVFYCLERRMGVGGGQEKYTVYCMSQLGSWVEFFFAVNIIVLWILAFVWLFNFLITTLFLTFFPLYNFKTHNPYTYRFQDFSFSQKLFVILLMQNLEPVLWRDIVKNIISTTDPRKIDDRWRQTQKKNLELRLKREQRQKMAQRQRMELRQRRGLIRRRNQFQADGQDESSEMMDQDYIGMVEDNGLDLDNGVSTEDITYRENYKTY
jgi:hypothetical protein